MSTLMDSGADPNFQDSSGHTPLHAATENGSYSAITFLLEAGANPDIRNVDGHTPLALWVGDENEAYHRLRNDAANPEAARIRQTKVDCIDIFGRADLPSLFNDPAARVTCLVLPGGLADCIRLFDRIEYKLSNAPGVMSLRSRRHERLWMDTKDQTGIYLICGKDPQDTEQSLAFIAEVAGNN